MHKKIAKPNRHPKVEDEACLATELAMLGQKEICGLMIIFCCSLAHSYYIPKCFDCRTCLRGEAEKLANATKRFVDFPDNSEVVGNIGAQLPRCNGSWDLSKNETHGIVKAFHTLFQQLSATVEGAEQILQNNLQQQEGCLDSCHVSSSTINITCKETDEAGRKVFLVKASKLYNCLMQQDREFRFCNKALDCAA